MDDRYVRMQGGLGTGRVAHYRRQVKYKLQASMEFGIITDCRTAPSGQAYAPALTLAGRELYQALRPLLDRLDLSQPVGRDGIPSSRMPEQPEFYNGAIRMLIGRNPTAGEVVRRLLLSMPAVRQMRLFLRRQPRAAVSKNTVYAKFFQQPEVVRFSQKHGIPPATQEGARHRCPFLLNVLDACGIIRQTQTTVTLV
ncbi:MAG: hypothetical protein HYS12_00860 [Planctomycetes bacterium]|nr:hypothetical protein [Planctomycetota bacterium]